MARLSNLVPDKARELVMATDRVNPYELKNGLEYEAIKKGYSCFSTLEEEDKKASIKIVEAVLKNLGTYQAYYSVLSEYEGMKTGGQFNDKKPPTFKKYLKTVTEAPKDKMEKSKLKESFHSLIKEVITEAKEEKKEKKEKKEPKTGLEGVIAKTEGYVNEIKSIVSEKLKETKQKLKELKPVLKELHAETEKKSARMPENKMGYMRVYESNPDVQNFLEVKRKLEEMIEIANSL
jgi:uroporphyrinogen-III decarboxylase